MTPSIKKRSKPGMSVGSILTRAFQIIPFLLKFVATVLVVFVTLTIGFLRGGKHRQVSVEASSARLAPFVGSGHIAMQGLKVAVFLAVFVAIFQLSGSKIGAGGFRTAPVALDNHVDVPATEPPIGQIPAPLDKKVWRRKDEVRLACLEVDCNDLCMKKTSKKCKSDGCLKTRARDCKKKCRKQRCELRCKDEPQLGYVEKEMKIEKCVEECQPANSEKCKAKCDKLFESCKVKCKSTLHKYQCDKAPPPPVKPIEDASPRSSASSDSGDDYQGGGGGDDADDDDDDLV